jgi:hypothetical protein
MSTCTVPDEGKLLVMFAPHVGIDAAGKVGAFNAKGKQRYPKHVGPCPF